MAYINHAFRVKHLNDTSGCKEYNKQLDFPNLAASRDSQVKCATNGCSGKGIRACHVIMANQNSESGLRMIIYCCPTCNGQKLGQLNDIRANAEAYILDNPECNFGKIGFKKKNISIIWLQHALWY